MSRSSSRDKRNAGHGGPRIEQDGPVADLADREAPNLTGYELPSASKAKNQTDLNTKPATETTAAHSDKAVQLARAITEAYTVCALLKSAQKTRRAAATALATAFERSDLKECKINARKLWEALETTFADREERAEVFAFTSQIVGATHTMTQRWSEFLHPPPMTVSSTSDTSENTNEKQLPKHDTMRMDFRRMGIAPIRLAVGPFSAHRGSAAQWVVLFGKYAAPAVEQMGDEAGQRLLDAWIGEGQNWLDSFREDNADADLTETLHALVRAFDSGEEYSLVFEIDKIQQRSTENVDQFFERKRGLQRKLALHKLNQEQIELVRFVGQLHYSAQVRLHAPANIDIAKQQARILETKPQGPSSQAKVKVCRSFQRTGECDYPECKFRHVRAQPSTPTPVTPRVNLATANWCGTEGSCKYHDAEDCFNHPSKGKENMSKQIAASEAKLQRPSLPADQKLKAEQTIEKLKARLMNQEALMTRESYSDSDEDHDQGYDWVRGWRT